MSKKLLVMTFSLILIFVVAPAALAQSGTIAGTVIDNTGAVIAGAQVSIRDVKTDCQPLDHDQHSGLL
jgi:hypothetical protein